jgi:hypothetical protein
MSINKYGCGTKADLVTIEPLIGPRGTYEADQFGVFELGPRGGIYPVGNVCIDRRIWPEYKRAITGPTALLIAPHRVTDPITAWSTA